MSDGSQGTRPYILQSTRFSPKLLFRRNLFLHEFLQKMDIQLKSLNDYNYYLIYGRNNLEIIFSQN